MLKRTETSSHDIRIYRRFFPVFILASLFFFNSAYPNDEEWERQAESFAKNVSPCIDLATGGRNYIIVKYRETWGILYFYYMYKPLFYILPLEKIKDGQLHKFRVSYPSPPGERYYRFITVRLDGSTLKIIYQNHAKALGDNPPGYRALKPIRSLTTPEIMGHIKRHLLKALNEYRPTPPSSANYSELGKKGELEDVKKCKFIQDPDIQKAADNAEKRFFEK
ncbi:MAG: hypothetical protein AABZ55_02595 [Bdellovibrionota bacterium]